VSGRPGRRWEAAVTEPLFGMFIWQVAKFFRSARCRTTLGDVALRILSRLGMSVTSDPVAEIDDELRRLLGDLKQCQARGESAMVERLTQQIDERLDERTSLAAPEPGPGRHRRPTTPTAASTKESTQRAHTG
jgi:hypothetical protein